MAGRRQEFKVSTAHKASIAQCRNVQPLRVLPSFMDRLWAVV